MPKPKTPKTPQQPKSLSHQQQRLLLDAFSRKGNLRDSTLILLVLKTGLKSGEVCGLNVGDVLKSSVAEFARIRVGTLKVRPEIATNKSARRLPLSEEVQNAIKDFLKWKQERGEYLEPTAPLFCTARTKKRLVPRDFQRIMEKASAILGEHITATDLRHTFGSELYQKTGDLETVCNALGLTSLKAAQIYRQTDSLPHVEKGSDIKSPTHDIDEVSIEGTLLMLDDATPHVVVVVQAAIPAADDKGEPTVVATALSDEVGKYQLRNLKPERYQVRCYTLNGYVYYQEGKSLQVESGVTLSNIDFRFAPFKKGTWKTISYLDGLADNAVFAIHSDTDGMMWFGTASGASRYDGKTFVNLTTEDGLAGNYVYAIYRDPDGILWFGTSGGVSRYDGKKFVNFTTKDGLVGDSVNVIYCDADGILWFGAGLYGVDGGVSRYDGKAFVNFTIEDGFVGRGVRAIYQDDDGVMWFGIYGIRRPGCGGVSRYEKPLRPSASLRNGKEFVNFALKDGLSDDRISDIYRDANGAIWFATHRGGVSRYSPSEFVNFTTKDGLLDDDIRVSYRHPDGHLWCGTGHGGPLATMGSRLSTSQRSETFIMTPTARYGLENQSEVSRDTVCQSSSTPTQRMKALGTMARLSSDSPPRMDC